MEEAFKTTRTSRGIYRNFMDRLTLEQLNKIPDGFSNNLIWNIGHIIVAQQMLVYGLSGLPMMVSDDMVKRYMRGTRPERDVTQEEADEIRSLLFSTVEKTEEDYRNGVFQSYTERNTELGFILSTVQDGITFNNYHEGTHLGIMMGIRKFL